MLRQFAFLALVFVSQFVFAQKSAPYQVDKKPLPGGTKFQLILPAQVGSFKRIEFKEPLPGLDGEALYKNGKEEIFMAFSLSSGIDDQRETMQTIFVETKKEATGELRDISLKTQPAYIHLIGKGIAFFAWTRGLYCFSADSKGGNAASLKQFLTAFPH